MFALFLDSGTFFWQKGEEARCFMELGSMDRVLGNTALEMANETSLVLRTSSARTAIPENAGFWLLGPPLPALCCAGRRKKGACP